MAGDLFKLAVAQTSGDLTGVQERLAWLDHALGEIAEQGADLVLLPELFACGYNIGATMHSIAETQEGPIVGRLAELAVKHGIAVHCGYAERDGDVIYNSAVCVGPDGAILDHYRKLAIPPGPEQGVFTAGQGTRVFTYRGLKLATLICYDVEFSEVARHLAGLGAQLLLAPTALGAQWDWVSEKLVPCRAYENGVYLAYANQAGQENGMAYFGGSFVAAPMGIEAARAGAAPEIIYAEIDPDRVTAAQERLPYLRDRHALRLDV